MTALHGFRIANDCPVDVGLRLGLVAGWLGHGLLPLALDAIQQRQQLPVGERFGDEVECAQLDCLHGQRDGPVAAHQHDHRGRVGAVLDPPHQLDPVYVGDLHVRQNQVKTLLLHPIQRLAAIAGSRQLVTFCRQAIRQIQPLVFVGVDNQDFHGGPTLAD